LCCQYCLVLFEILNFPILNNCVIVQRRHCTVISGVTEKCCNTYSQCHIYQFTKMLYLCLIFPFLPGPGGSVVGSNSSCKPITNMAWVRAQLCKLQKGCTRLAAASDKAYQLLVQGRWFSPGTPASSTTKTGRHCYSWNTAESGVKTQKIKNKPILTLLHIGNPILCSSTLSRIKT
jgi:hypothetical protein